MSQEKIILKFSPDEQIITTKSTLSLLPYFRYIFDNYQMPKEIFLDKDKDVVNHCLEIYRNSGLYEYPEWIEQDLEYFQIAENGYIYPEEEIIKINVSGDIFWTTKKTLCKSDMLNAFLNGNLQKNTDNNNDNDEIFLDRNPIAFKEVLSYLRNVQYPFSKKYLYELEYYGITWVKDSFEEDTKKLKEPFVFQNDHQFYEFLTRNYETYEDSNFKKGISNFTPYQEGINQNQVCKNSISRNLDVPKNVNQSMFLKEFSPDFNNNIWGRIFKYRLNHLNNTADLLHKLFLQFYIPKLNREYFKNPEMLPFNIIKSVKVYSDDYLIDEMSGELLYIWMLLYHPKDYNIFCNQQKDNHLIVPLYFFFHESRELSVNLSGTTSNIYIQIETNILSDLLNYNSFDIINKEYENYSTMRLMGYTVYLSTDERNYIKQFNFHNTFLQHTYCHQEYFYSNDFRINLRFSRPIYQILFTIVPKLDFDSELDKYYYADILEKATLRANNHILYQVDATTNLIDKQINNIINPNVPIYSITFGILDKNNIHNKSAGTINFTNFDDAILEFKINNKIQNGGIVKIWPIRYNMLSVMTDEKTNSRPTIVYHNY